MKRNISKLKTCNELHYGIYKNNNTYKLQMKYYINWNLVYQCYDEKIEKSIDWYFHIVYTHIMHDILLVWKRSIIRYNLVTRKQTVPFRSYDIIKGYHVYNQNVIICINVVPWYGNGFNNYKFIWNGHFMKRYQPTYSFFAFLKTTEGEYIVGIGQNKLYNFSTTVDLDITVPTFCASNDGKIIVFRSGYQIYYQNIYQAKNNELFKKNCGAIHIPIC